MELDEEVEAADRTVPEAEATPLGRLLAAIKLDRDPNSAAYCALEYLDGDLSGMQARHALRSLVGVDDPVAILMEYTKDPDMYAEAAEKLQEIMKIYPEIPLKSLDDKR